MLLCFGTGSETLKNEWYLIFKMTSTLSQSIPQVPTNPGVYLMKDQAGTIIYVGKAINLKKRLANYFTKIHHTDVKTGILVKKIASFETIITGTEKEALILESNLIKKYRPRYNVILKDDKRYPSLRIDTTQTYPNITIIRKRVKDQSTVFGPFSSAGAVKETLKFINKNFKLRKCKQKEVPRRRRPCLNYQINACLAPCSLDVDPKKYRKIIDEVILFLKGKTPELIQHVKSDMVAAAEAKDYETAAELRDKMFALEKTLEKQVAATSDFKDRDVLAVVSESVYSVITMLTVRNGFLRGSRTFKFSEAVATDAELLETVIRQYYDGNRFVPQEILTSLPLDSANALSQILTDSKGQKVALKYPQRGEKKRLTDMALKNAQNALKETTESDRARAEKLKRLQDRLRLNYYPSRIECFDNSNISGTSAVAAMVVFENAEPAKAHYRKYNIKASVGPDDYGHMKEVLERRFKPSKAEAILPNLLMVDGGKGQLHIAMDVIHELGLENTFDVVAIAKKNSENNETEDKIFKPNRVNPINFGKDADLLLFLERIRDEAHRFAISFHRKKRSKNALDSILDHIEGVGKKRKAMLLKHFGSVHKIQAATPEELGALPGITNTLAKLIQSELNALDI